MRAAAGDAGRERGPSPRERIERERAARPLAALDAFVSAAPWPERLGIRALLALGARPRGAALLARLPAADQLARATLALGRYDDAAAGRALGWDPDAIVARGRRLRSEEGRGA